MTPPQVLPRSAWSLLPLLLVNWSAFAHVLSVGGVLLWVIIPSLIAVQAMIIMVWADRRILAGVVLFGLVALAVGLSEFIGGTTSGPITRSTLMMTTCAGLMMLLWRTSVPASAALVSLAALGGALGLGTADRTVWLVGVWMVAVAVYLAAVGPLRTVDLREPGRLRGFVLMLLAAGLVATLAGNVLQTVMPDPWTIPSLGAAVVDGQTPPGMPSDPAATTTPATPTVVPAAPDTTDASDGGATSLLTSLAQVVAAFLLVVLLLLAVALAYVHLRWVLLRVRLRRGTPAQQVSGAWYWLRWQWARSGHFERRTPDRIAREVSDDDPLGDLAELATRALYARDPDITADQARQAWSVVPRLHRRVPRSWTSRLRALLITPAAARRRLAATAPSSRSEPLAATARGH